MQQAKPSTTGMSKSTPNTTQQKMRLYLDYAASAPLRNEARAAQEYYRALPCAPANPNSLHSMGREAAAILEESRDLLCSCVGLGFRPFELTFTSGGTEANNLALLGIAEGCRLKDPHKTRVLVSAVEHDSVLDVARLLHRRGFSVERIGVNRKGLVEASSLKSLLADDVCLVSVMLANNETGVIQEVNELAQIAHGAGAFFHSDAIQAFCHVPLDAQEVDAITLAAHKIGASVGTGALLVRSSVPFEAQSEGGGQEHGRRAGTQDVCGAYVFAQTAQALTLKLTENRELCAARANHLYELLCSEGTGIYPTVAAPIDEGRLPGIVSVYVKGIDAETLIMHLDARGFEVSQGSACSSGSLDPSHVLLAMGIPKEDAFGSLRISFDERISQEELERFAYALLELVQEQLALN